MRYYSGYPFGVFPKEGDAMHKTGWKVLAVAIGLLLATGVPYLAVTAVQADPGCGHGCGHGCGQQAACGCECGYPKEAGQAGAGPPCAMHDNTMACHACKHRMMHGDKGGPPMKAGMAKHTEEVRGMVKKLREIEAKMAGQIKDGEAFRASSLEHARLLTDLQESHLKHMEAMTGGGK